MKILAAIIAGGASRRMDHQEKALTVLEGVTLLGRIYSRIQMQVSDVIINANGDASRFEAFELPVVPDQLAHVGTPLAGVHAALAHAEAHGHDAVLTVPSDCPFLPLDLVPRLTKAGAATGAAVATSAGQVHYLTGLWSTAVRVPLEQRMLSGAIRRVQDLVAMLDTAECDWPTHPHDPFLNINTPADLARAARILHG